MTNKEQFKQLRAENRKLKRILKNVKWIVNDMCKRVTDRNRHSEKK